jgi:hypothetical protein
VKPSDSRRGQDRQGVNLSDYRYKPIGGKEVIPLGQRADAEKRSELVKKLGSDLWEIRGDVERAAIRSALWESLKKGPFDALLCHCGLLRSPEHEQQLSEEGVERNVKNLETMAINIYNTHRGTKATVKAILNIVKEYKDKTQQQQTSE